MAGNFSWHILISPTPQLRRLGDLLSDGPRENLDTWFTTADLRVDQDIPGIPIDYATLEAMGKCLYVRGIPPDSTADEVKGLFMPFGCVVKCPSLISLGSEDVFRWVIMGTREEASFAQHQLHMTLISRTERLFVSKALAPGRTMTLVQKQVLEGFGQIEDMSNQKTPRVSMKDTSHETTPRASNVATFHGHPSPSKPLPKTPSPKKTSLPGIVVPLTHPLPPKPEEGKPPAQPAIGTGRRAPGTTQPPSRIARSLLAKEFPALGSSALIKNSVPEVSSTETSKWLTKLVERNVLGSEAGLVENDDSSTEELKSRNLNSTSMVRHKMGSVGANIEKAIPNDTEPKPTSPSSMPTTTVPRTSWASIASSSNPEAKVIDLHPESKAALAAPTIQATARRVLSNPRSAEAVPDDDDPNRVVWLLNLPISITLQDISDAVIEGPLAKIQLGPKDEEGNRFAGIIFQNGWDAKAFLGVLQNERRTSRPGRFRFIVDAEMGELYYPDNLIKAMGKPIYATRRLTLVKARFFFMFGEKPLRDLCKKLVGEENIQLIWLYNGGNATIVFSDVLSAIKVKEELDARAASAGKPGGESPIWEDLATNFSKDPCVQPMQQLVTTLHD